MILNSYIYWLNYSIDILGIYKGLFYRTIIQLPTNKNKPDYEIMEILISAIQKMFIKDLVNVGGEESLIK